MKIHFFKNSSNIYPRISCVWEGVEKSMDYPTISKPAKNIVIAAVYMISIIAFVLLFKNYRNNGIGFLYFVLISCIVLLPLHEFCHALYCILARKEIEGIYFFTSNMKTLFSSPTAYVNPSFGIYNKYQWFLLRTFPLLLLTIFPLTVGIFATNISKYCYFIAISNFTGSVFDICDILAIIKLPKNGLIFTPFGVIVPDSNTMIFRTISKKGNSDILIKRQFVYKNKNFSEISFEENQSSINIENEFIVQYGLKRKIHKIVTRHGVKSRNPRQNFDSHHRQGDSLSPFEKRHLNWFLFFTVCARNARRLCMRREKRQKHRAELHKQA